MGWVIGHGFLGMGFWVFDGDVPGYGVDVDTKQKIIQSQRSILDKLVAFEQAVGDLYEVYSFKFQEEREFWQRISLEEYNHATVLKKLENVLSQGYLLFNIGRFDDKSINMTLSYVKRQYHHAVESEITLSQALSVATGIEASILDGSFYEVVQSDAEAFQQIACMMVTHTRKHRQILQEKMTSYLA